MDIIADNKILILCFLVWIFILNSRRGYKKEMSNLLDNKTGIIEWSDLSFNYIKIPVELLNFVVLMAIYEFALAIKKQYGFKSRPNLQENYYEVRKNCNSVHVDMRSKCIWAFPSFLSLDDYNGALLLRRPWYQLIQFEWHRYLSFEKLPPTSFLKPMRLAQAGFYYLGERQAVKCFCCGLRNDTWTREETAIEVHRRLSPSCPFILERNSGNIPINSPTDHSEHLQESRGQFLLQNRDIHGRTYLSDTAAFSDRGPIDNEIMENESARFITYSNHQFPSNSKAYPLRLAKAGFYYNGVGELVQCYCCGVTHGQWSDTEDVMDVHRRISPYCRHVRTIDDEIARMRTERNLPQPDIFVDTSVKYAQYSTYISRFSTFENWHFPERSEQMAHAGLFFTGYQDEVRCFHCGIVLHKWEKTDDPLFEHRRFSPKCKFVQQSGHSYIQSKCDLQKVIECLEKELKTCKEEKQVLENKEMCKVCLMQNKDMMAFVPCGHSACISCAEQIEKCAICRSFIKEKIRLYYS